MLRAPPALDDFTIVATTLLPPAIYGQLLRQSCLSIPFGGTAIAEARELLESPLPPTIVHGMLLLAITCSYPVYPSWLAGHRFCSPRLCPQPHGHHSY